MCQEMEPFVQILGLILMIVAFLSGGFLVAVQPVWGIVDAAVSQRLSTGAKVTIIEKTDLVGGTTAVSGGVLWIPNNHHMADAGIQDSRDDALEEERPIAHHPGDR